MFALAFSPNGEKLAIATCDRQILLYDEKGERKDKFSTKPSDPEAGKKSYLVTAVAFSPDSTKLAVAQTDCMVYVYKLGKGWGEKKVTFIFLAVYSDGDNFIKFQAICNKFPQPCPVLCLVWLLGGPIICGLTNGKVRALQVRVSILNHLNDNLNLASYFQIKSNKSQSIYSTDSLTISLAANSRGTGFLSGHVDGSVIKFLILDDRNLGDSQGKILVHPVPPSALAWLQGNILAAGCDKRIVIYNSQGKALRSFDYNRVDDEREFTVAVASPSGQVFIDASRQKPCNK